MTTAARAIRGAERSVAAVVNASARQGGAERADWLAGILRDRYGVEAQIALAQSRDELLWHARDAARGPGSLVIAAGGDGTINAVAAQLVGTEKRLAVMPFGTLNHFAKDLRIPLDAEAAVQTIFGGRALAVDVGSVNGQYFLNNSSLGIYPQLVAAREAHQQSGRSKWIAWLPAIWKTLRRYPVLAVRLNTERHALVRRTPIVFIGNNAYELEGWGIGSRACLDQGRLQLSVMRHAGRWSLIRMFLSAFIGRLQQVREFDSLCTEELWIDSRRKRLKVSLDGELTTLRPPLHYRVHARALNVMVPMSPQAE